MIRATKVNAASLAATSSRPLASTPCQSVSWPIRNAWRKSASVMPWATRRVACCLVMVKSDRRAGQLAGQPGKEYLEDGPHVTCDILAQPFVVAGRVGRHLVPDVLDRRRHQVLKRGLHRRGDPRHGGMSGCRRPHPGILAPAPPQRNHMPAPRCRAGRGRLALWGVAAPPGVIWRVFPWPVLGGGSGLDGKREWEHRWRARLPQQFRGNRHCPTGLDPVVHREQGTANLRD